MVCGCVFLSRVCVGASGGLNVRQKCHDDDDDDDDPYDPDDDGAAAATAT